jgi:hypothetical protein
MFSLSEYELDLQSRDVHDGGRFFCEDIAKISDNSSKQSDLWI